MEDKTIAVETGSFILIVDKESSKVLASFDITNVGVDIMEYYYHYFGGYKEYISYLTKIGAKRVQANNKSTYLQSKSRIFYVNKNVSRNVWH